MNRLENVEHPFFTDKRDYFEAYVQGKVSSKKLGREVSSKLIDEVARLDAENESLVRENDRLKDNRIILEDISKVLRKHGMNSYFKSSFADEIDQALNNSLPPNIERDLRDLKNISDRMLGRIS